MATPKPPKSLGGKPETHYYREMDAWSQSKDVQIAAAQKAIANPPPVTVLGSPATGGDLTLSGNLTANTILSGSVKIFDPDVSHAARKLMLHASAFRNRTDDYITIGNFVQMVAGEASPELTSASGAPSEPVWACIPLSIGDRILEVDLYVRGAAPASNVVTLKVWKQDLTTLAAPSQLGATLTSVNTATAQTLARTGLTEVVADGFGYFLSALITTGTPGIRGARVIYDRP